MENKIKYCTNCGNQLNGEKFCSNCGHSAEKHSSSPKINTEDITVLLNRIKEKTVGYIGAIIGAIFVLMLFADWFVLSLGEIGHYITDNYGVSLNRSLSPVTLLPGLIKLGKIAGESDALLWGMLFAIILIGASLFIVGYAISAIRNSIYHKNKIETLNGLAVSSIVTACIAIIGVWILKVIIDYAMNDIGLGIVSSVATDVVAFTKAPVIMLVMGIALKVYYSTHQKQEFVQTKKRYDLFSDSKLMVLYFSADCTFEERAIIRNIAENRKIDVEKKRNQYDYICDMYSDKTDSELSEISRTFSEDDLNKEIAKTILKTRKDSVNN